MTLAPGSSFAGYTIIRLLGQGAQGAVYVAQHPRLPRYDALKLLQGAYASNEQFRARFEREADIAAQLRHPNIVSVYDRGVEGDQLWISMQYVEGKDAADLIKAGPSVLTAERAVGIVGDVGKALDYAHRHGLLHRDVKPANILITPPIDQHSRENAVITDFGIAKAADTSQGLTMPGDVLATMAYAAPEQLEGGAVDHRSDIYALGCTLYEMLTGSVPYKRPTASATIMAHFQAPPPRPSEARPGLPVAMDRVIAKAIAKNPADRYNSCHELTEEAARALNMRTDFGRATTSPPPSSSRRGLVIGIAAAVAVAAIVAGVIFAVSKGSDDNGGSHASSATTSSVTETTDEPVGNIATASDGSFELSLPDGWSSIEDDEYLAKLEVEDTNANILISFNGGSTLGDSIDESAELTSKIIEDELKGVVDAGGIEATTVDGEPARRITYTLYKKDTGYDNDVRGRQLFTRHDDAEYLITFSGTAAEFNSLVADLEAIVDSWHWLN